MRQWIQFAQAVNWLDEQEAELAAMVEDGVADFRVAAQTEIVEYVENELNVAVDDLAALYGYDEVPVAVVPDRRRPASEIEEDEWLAS